MLMTEDFSFHRVVSKNTNELKTGSRGRFGLEVVRSKYSCGYPMVEM